MSGNASLVRNADDNDKAAVSSEKWRKSSFSGSIGDCVEVSSTNRIKVRDSKAPSGLRLQFSPDAWTAFVGNLQNGCSVGGGIVSLLSSSATRSCPVL
jgi:hypothetical protein